MEQKGLFEEEEEGKAAGDTEAGGEELEGLFEKEAEQPKKSNLKLFLLIGLVLVAGGYIATLFLFKEEKPVVPEVMKIPIKGAPGMANITGAKAVMAKQEATEKAEAKVETKEAKKPEEVKEKVEVKEAKKLEEVKEKPKVESKVEEKKPEPKPEVKKPAEVKVAKKEEAAVKAAKPVVEQTKVKGLTVVIGIYATKYDLEAAEDKLKGTGIRHSAKEIKKKLMMNRVLVGEVKDKGEVNRLISELRVKGYDPFPVSMNGTYKVYAVSNLNEEISKNNKADLERLGYTPSIEKKDVTARVYELSVAAKNKNEIGELSVRLKKMGFEPKTK